jgi:hypothetical protein
VASRTKSLTATASSFKKLRFIKDLQGSDKTMYKEHQEECTSQPQTSHPIRQSRPLTGLDPQDRTSSQQALS